MNKSIKDNSALRSLFEDYLEHQAFIGFPEVLIEPARHIMRIKGKRIRPLMVLTACQSFLGDVRQALGPASAMEIFHNFSLVHDDIIDKSDVRRGQPTVHKVFGLNKAILTGDAMLLHAFSQISKGPDDNLGALLSVFRKAAAEVIEGEQYDVNFEDIAEIKEDDYLMMIRLKTSVLLAASAQLGAIVAGASAADQQNIYDFGLNLGLAFQIKDDYLDAYGNAEKFGKRIGGDIIQNKKTWLLITALKHADKSDRRKIFDLFNETNEKAKIEGMLVMFGRLGVKEQAISKMETLYGKSLESLNRLSIDETARRPLLSLADLVYHRQH